MATPSYSMNTTSSRAVTDMIDKLLFWLITAILALPWLSLHSGTPLPYRYHPCTGRDWKRAFPNQSANTIRSFLACLTDGFAFPTKDMLRFKPTDNVLDIYRAIYGGRTPLGDAMECETFLDNLSARFDQDHVLLYATWHEQITLEELFATCSSNTPA